MQKIRAFAEKHFNTCVFLMYLLFSFSYFSYALFTGQIMANGDSFYYNYPLRLYYSNFIKDGLSLWLPYQFLGIPFFGSLQTGLLYPLNIIYFIIPAPHAFNISIIIHYSLAAFFTFLYLRLLNLKKYPAFLSGIVFAFCGSMISKIGYTSMINAIIWLPLLLYFYEKIIQTLKWKYTFLASLIVAIQILAGHFQISVYTYIVLGLYVLFFIFGIEKGKRFRFLVLVSLPIILGAIISLPQLIATKELSENAWRLGLDYSFFTHCSYHPFMMLLMIFPFLFGKGYGDMFFYTNKVNTTLLWPEWQIFEYISFIGIFILFLSILIFFKLRKTNKHVFFWGIMCFIAIFLALGSYNPLYKIMYYIPVYNFFRIPARHLLEFSLGISVLFAFGIEYLFFNIKKDKSFIYKLMIIIILTTAFCEAIPILCSILKILEANIHIFTASEMQMLSVLSNDFKITNPVFWVPFAFALAYVAMLFLLIRFQHKKILPLAFLSTIIIIEIFIFGSLYQNDCRTLSEIDKNSDNQIFDTLKSKSPYDRTLFLANEGVYPLYFVSNKIGALDGFDPLIIQSFTNLTGITMDNHCDWLTLLKNNILLSSLNIKYITIFPDAYSKVNQIFDMKSSKGVSKATEIPAIFNKWTYQNANPYQKNHILKSPDGKIFGTIEHEIILKPNTTYMLSLEATSENFESHVNAGIRSNTTSAYEGEWSFILFLNKSNNYSAHDFKVFSTGSKSLSLADIIVKTNSTAPVTIKNIKFSELKNYSPFSILNSGNEAPYKTIFQKEGTIILENTNCLPKAFSVENVIAVESENEIKKAFYLQEFNPAETAFVYNKDMPCIGQENFSPGKVSVKQYKPDIITLEADFEGKGLLVLAEQYYPGWEAFIDGTETKIFPVNGLLRGVIVPKGKHSIIFKYAPANIFFGFVLGASALMLCIFSITIIYLKERTKK